MFKLLVYLNLIFAVLYFLLYLQEGSWYAISGILMVIAFSVLSMTEDVRFTAAKKLAFYSCAIVSAGFSGFLVFSSLYIVLDAIDHDYFPLRIILFCAFGLAFSFSILSILIYVFLYKGDRRNV
jgi:hypothetical protein